MDESVPQYLRDHASHLRVNPLSVCSTTLRYHQADGLTLLALMASHGRSGYQAFLEEMRRAVAEGLVPAEPVNVFALASLARASLGWRGPGGDVRDSADLFQALRLIRQQHDLKPGEAPRGNFERFEVQTALALGRTDQVGAVVPQLTDDDVRWSARTELAHPDRGLAGATWDGWLKQFNEIFEVEGLAPIALAPGDGAPFDRVVPARPPVRVDRPGPLVTVIMAVFKPDESFFTGLRSMVDQTWSNLEVLVVDDCSPESYRAVLDEGAALDDRIILHRMPVNGGPYRIRNFALTQARGDFVTFQDADDWSHPERIERQIRPLLDDPSLVASFSRSVRVTSGLSLNKIGFAPTRRNVSSILFRRETVIDALGGFDEVRKSGDSEFSDRMQLVFGEERIHWLEIPMALVQLTEGSLSREDFQLGWHAPDRFLYRQAFEYWHAQLAAGAESPRLEPGTRRFPAPAGHLGLALEAQHVEVAVVSDWRSGVARYDGVAEEVETLVAAGLSTTVLHIETMRFTKRRREPHVETILRLQHEGRLKEARWDAPLEAELVIVRDPELLSYPRPADESQVRARRVVITAAFAPRAPDGGWLVYDPAVVAANAEALFGVAPDWLPATADIGEAIGAEGVAELVLPPAQIGVVDVTAPPRGPWSARPVLGTAGLERLQRDRLSAEELLRMLPQDERLDVRIRDNQKALDTRTAPKPLPPSWQLKDAEPLDDFLASLDVFVCWRRRTVGTETPHTALRAMALGCVVLAPPELESHFGTAAIYTDGRAVADIVLELAADPSRIEALRRRGHDFVATHGTPEVLVTRVRELAQHDER